MSLYGMSDGQDFQQTFSRVTGRKCCDGKKKKWDADALQTTYQKEYYEKEAPRAIDRLHIIAAPRDPPAVFDPTTTYGGDFKQKENTRREMIRPPQGEQEKAPFQGQSTYASNFDPKTATYQRVKPQYQVASSPGPFEDDTTNKLDYKNWGAPKPRMMMQQPGIPRNTGAFAGQSVYADNFKRHAVAKREPATKMPDSDAYPKGPLDTNTTYSTGYTLHQVVVPERCRPEDSRVQDLGWYDGVPTTEYGNHFIEKAGAAAKPAERLHGQRPFPTGDFDGSTNYGKDFQQREPGSRTQSMKPRGAELEKLPFAGESTYNDTYLKRDAPQYQRVKPKSTFEPNPAAFEGVSTNRADYKQWEAKPVTRIAPVGAALRTGGPFEGTSTYNGAYQKVQGRAAALMRPERSAHSAGAFDGTTTYRVDFVEKEKEYVPQRPASVCSSCRDGGITM